MNWIQYIWQAEFWIWDWTTLKMELCLWFPWFGSWRFLQISKTCASQGLGVHSVSEHKKWYLRNYTKILENSRNTIVFFLVWETNFSMSKEIRNTILKIFKWRNSKKETIWIVLCGLIKKVSQSWLQCYGQGPLSQKVKIIGGVTNI